MQRQARWATAFSVTSTLFWKMRLRLSARFTLDSAAVEMVRLRNWLRKEAFGLGHVMSFCFTHQQAHSGSQRRQRWSSLECSQAGSAAQAPQSSIWSPGRWERSACPASQIQSPGSTLINGDERKEALLIFTLTCEKQIVILLILFGHFCKQIPSVTEILEAKERKYYWKYLCSLFQGWPRIGRS